MVSNTFSDYMIFGGGYNGELLNGVEGFDSSLTKRTFPPLSTARYNFEAASNKNYIVFAGGTDGGSYLVDTDAYDSDFTKVIATELN